MKRFVIAFLVLSVGLAVQSLTRDENGARPSLRTFLLLYLLRPQDTTNTAAVTPPTNATIILNSATNTSNISLAASRSLMRNRLTKLDVAIGEADDVTETYYVPDDYYDMVSNIADEYRKQVDGIEIVTDKADIADNELTSNE